MMHGFPALWTHKDTGDGGAHLEPIAEVILVEEKAPPHRAMQG